MNNVFVSATNLEFDPRAYIDAYPLELVEEFHLAGHDEDADELGRKLLIDSHGTPVDEPVWTLFDHVVARAGARPALVEWDNDVPEWDVLEAEAARATRHMEPAIAAKVPA